MDEQDISILFKAMANILENQDKIMKHLGLNKFDSDYGYNNYIESLSYECSSISRHYKEKYE